MRCIQPSTDAWWVGTSIRSSRSRTTSSWASEIPSLLPTRACGVRARRADPRRRPFRKVGRQGCRVQGSDPTGGHGVFAGYHARPLDPLRLPGALQWRPRLGSEAGGRLRDVCQAPEYRQVRRVVDVEAEPAAWHIDLDLAGCKDERQRGKRPQIAMMTYSEARAPIHRASLNQLAGDSRPTPSGRPRALATRTRPARRRR